MTTVLFGETKVEDTHRKGFENESFTFNAGEKDRRAAAGYSDKLRHEDMVLQKQKYVNVIVSGIGFVLLKAEDDSRS